MATTTEVFKVEIAGQERVINSAKELKKAIKDAQDEVIKGTPGANKALAQLQDKLEDVKDSAKTVKGGGLEPLTGSLGLLKDGFGSLDFEKVKLGFSGLGKAMMAVPFLFVVEAIRYLIDNFDELSEGSGLLGKTLRGIGEVIDFVTGKIAEFTDWIGLSNSALDKQGEAIKENASKAKEAIAQQNAEYDRQIAIAKASGKSAIDLEKQKLENIVNTNKALVEQTIAYVRAGGVLNDERKKLLNEQLEAIRNARTQEKVSEITHNKELNEKYKEHLAEKNRADGVRFEAKKQIDEQTAQAEIDAQIAALDETEAIKDAKRQAEVDKDLAARTEVQRQIAYLEIEQAKKTAAEKAAIDKATTDQSFAVAKASIDSQAQLVNFLFDLKRSRAKKGSEEDLKLAKRQFQINKGLAITNSVISGIQGVINALSAQSVIPEPYGTILKVANAVAVGIAATVNTAKIASQKFDDGGGASGGGGGGDAAASVGAAATAAPPVPAINTPQNTPQTTLFDDEGKNTSIKVKAEVVETEATSTQKRVSRLENQASF